MWCISIQDSVSPCLGFAFLRVFYRIDFEKMVGTTTHAILLFHKSHFVRLICSSLTETSNSSFMFFGMLISGMKGTPKPPFYCKMFPFFSD